MSRRPWLIVLSVCALLVAGWAALSPASPQGAAPVSAIGTGILDEPQGRTAEQVQGRAPEQVQGRAPEQVPAQPVDVADDQPATGLGAPVEVSPLDTAPGRPDGPGPEPPGTRPATLDSLSRAGDETPRPTRVTIPALQIQVEVDPVGVRADGQMEIPDRGDRVGWYRFGAHPGADRGSAVLASHVNTSEDGPGVLAEIGDLAVGYEVVVDTTAGEVRYAVTARRTVAKSELDTRALFDRDGTARLVLVTCGGPWVPQDGAYRDNVLVEATPLGEDG